MTDKYRTVYRVLHGGELVGEYDARYYAENVQRSQERSCHVPGLGETCDQVSIQAVEINDETGEETDVT